MIDLENNSAFYRIRTSNHHNHFNYAKDSNDVQQMLSKILGKSDTVAQEQLRKIRKKINDDELYDKVQSEYINQKDEAVDYANKFLEQFRNKYGDRKYPFHKLLEKARHFKDRYNMSDASFAEFKRQYENKLAGGKNSNSKITPYNKLTKTLGIVDEHSYSDMTIKDKDYVHMQEILKINEQTKKLHSDVVLQSLTYVDCAYQVINYIYDRQKIMGVDKQPVHPIICALFMPKIKYIDERMLVANLSNVIKSRYEKVDIQTKPDYDMYWSLITDPNDIVCNESSTVEDLKHRCVIQSSVWNSVLQLRNGIFFYDGADNFITSLNSCKMSQFDIPDIIYANDDATAFRRLFNAFSLRPTVVVTRPLTTSTITSQMPTPYFSNNAPEVNTIPMINMQIPNVKPAGGARFNLSDSLRQMQYYFNTSNSNMSTILPKQQEIFYSEDIVVFNINRKTYTVDVEGLNKPYAFSNLPASISSLQSLNTTEVHFTETMDINNFTYELRSVVIAKVLDVGGTKDAIVGSSTLVREILNPDLGRYTNDYWIYSPSEVNNVVRDATTGNVGYREPLYNINFTDRNVTNFYDLASTHGLIFIYSKQETSRTVPNIMYA